MAYYKGGTIKAYIPCSGLKEAPYDNYEGFIYSVDVQDISLVEVHHNPASTY